MIFGAVLCAIGNVIFAVTPDFAGLVIGRAVAGFGVGIAVVAGPVFARATGGVERVGLFGAAIQLGIAGGLGMGAILGDLESTGGSRSCSPPGSPRRRSGSCSDAPGRATSVRPAGASSGSRCAARGSGGSARSS